MLISRNLFWRELRPQRNEGQAPRKCRDPNVNPVRSIKQYLYAYLFLPFSNHVSEQSSLAPAGKLYDHDTLALFNLLGVAGIISKKPRKSQQTGSTFSESSKLLKSFLVDEESESDPEDSVIRKFSKEEGKLVAMNDTDNEELLEDEGRDDVEEEPEAASVENVEERNSDDNVGG